MKFCSLVLELLLPQNCHTYTETDKHFPEIVKSCSGHPKTCKFIKNRKSKICTKPVLSSMYIEESKKFETHCLFSCKNNKSVIRPFERWPTICLRPTCCKYKGLLIISICTLYITGRTENNFSFKEHYIFIYQFPLQHRDDEKYNKNIAVQSLVLPSDAVLSFLKKQVILMSFRKLWITLK